MIAIMKADKVFDNVQFFLNTVEELEQLKDGVYNGYTIGHGSTAMVKETKQIFFYDEENNEWFVF